MQHPVTATTKTADCIILNSVPCNLIGQRAAKRRAVFSLVSPEACCDVTEASTECNGAVARSRNAGAYGMQMVSSPERSGLLLLKVRSCCTLTILYKTYSTVGWSIASI